MDDSTPAAATEITVRIPTDLARRLGTGGEVERRVGGLPALRRTLSGAEAEAKGWFRGPPYAVVERVRRK